MKRWQLCVVFLYMVILLVACTKTSDNAENRTLHIGLMPDIGMYPFLVAEAEGYFKDANLNIEFTVFKSAKDRDAALQGQQINGMMGDLLANYYLNTSDLKVKAVSYTESRFLLLAGENSGIINPEDLRDVEIGLSVNTVIEYIVDTYLADKNITARKMSVPQVPVRMELLRSGQLKAAAMPDPLATVLTKSGAKIIADSRNMQLNPAVLIFTEDTINTQPKVLQDFFKVYNKAVQFINENPEKYRHLLLEKGGFPESVISDIEIPEFREAEVPAEAEVRKIVDWVKAKGEAKKDLTYSDLVESVF